jgi:hypothetical protein
MGGFGTDVVEKYNWFKNGWYKYLLHDFTNATNNSSCMVLSLILIWHLKELNLIRVNAINIYLREHK